LPYKLEKLWWSASPAAEAFLFLGVKKITGATLFKAAASTQKLAISHGN
jgi:hypothetical protein